MYFKISETYLYNSLAEFYSSEELESKNFREFRLKFKDRKQEDFKASSFPQFHQAEKMRAFIDLFHENYSSKTFLEKRQNKKTNDKSSPTKNKVNLVFCG